MHICIYGYPGLFGGAEVELWHLCDAFRKAGVGVHLVTEGEPPNEQRETMDAMGCITHQYHPAIFRDQVVLSLCNGDFLKRLPEIHAAGKPRFVLWSDCMAKAAPTYAKAEHTAGLIDHHLFQSRYMRNNHVPALEEGGVPVRVLEGYRPYFSWARGKEEGIWAPECPCNKDGAAFNVGRLSRDDFYKYPDHFWENWQRIDGGSRPVKLWVLGYGQNARNRCGEPPEGANVYPHLGMAAADFLSRLDVMVHQTGGSGENWPRVLFEAWASGVVPIMDADGGPAELITDGVDGFLVRSGEQAAERASQIAQDDALRSRLVKAGYDTLLREHCDIERSVGPFLPLLEGCPEVIAPVMRKAGKLDHERLRAINESQNEICRNSSRFMVAQWHIHDGKINLSHHDHDFPKEDLAKALAMLAADLGLAPPAEEAPQPRKLTVGVMTFPGSPMPGAQRATWIPVARALGIEVIFYSGGGSEHDSDTLRFPVESNYGGMVLRFNAFAQWFRENRPDSWLFDCDDDTLVIPERLLAYLETAADYCGFDLGAYGSGGAGTLLSPKAVQILAENPLPNLTGWDDLQIGEVLRSHGINLTHDERFRPWCNSDPNDGNEPGPQNAYISGHCKPPEANPREQRVALMRKLWVGMRPLVIGVHTFPGSPLPQACRETWIPRARELGIEVLFYSGAEPCVTCNGKRLFSQEGDVLRFPVETDYVHSCDRMEAFTKWLALNRPGCWLLDVDDDTFVHPDRLLAMLPLAGEYVGWGCDANHRIGHGGAGTLLSPRAVGILAEKGLPATGHDDIEVGNVMWDAGVGFVHDVRFRPYRNSAPGEQNEPTKLNDYITGHCKSGGGHNDPLADRIELMRKIWKEVA